jgi:cellulose synthase/poly-beta-1,6-N-acetylglucosamine synthase-like glycosyltransferase
MSVELLPCLLAFALALVFALVVNGWRQRIEEALQTTPPSGMSDPAPMVTLIVPARNAADTITALLQDLHAQTWPREQLEVLVIDDDSTDDTKAVVERLARTWPQLRCLANAGEGKKAAITTGAEAAHGELLILADADARCGRARVERIVKHQQAHGSDLVLLPVGTVSDGRLIGRIQEAEQAALLGVAAATALDDRPILANGANMAFTREAFFRSGGYTGDRWASGDDIFLLDRFRRAGKRITYLLDREAVVTVEAEPSFARFWQQRLRWAGKMRGVPGAGKWLGALGLLLPWILLVLTCAFDAPAAASQGLFGGALLLVSAWLLWIGPVLVLVRTADRFLERRSHAIVNAFALVAFTVYAPLVALCALFVRPTWKGRKIR